MQAKNTDFTGTLSFGETVVLSHSSFISSDASYKYGHVLTATREGSDIVQIDRYSIRGNTIHQLFLDRDNYISIGKVMGWL